MQPTQTQQLDPQAVALAKAIRRAESNDNFEARGKSGEWGAYQFMPETWKGYAQETGVNAEFGKASRQQQNEVAYKKIKQWKDQGFNPGQIASMWNAGPGRPNAYKEGWKGVNSQGVAYDTPAYAEKVARNYQLLKAEMQVLDPSRQTQQQPGEKPKEPGLLAELKDASNKRLGQANTAIDRGLAGEQGIGSTALQVGGAAAGGILDVIGAGVKAIPVVGDVVEGAENLLGKGAAKVMETDAGQAALEGYQKFATENPTAAANIGAVGNIASAIPIVRGVGAGVRGAFSLPGKAIDAVTPNATKVNNAVQELEQTIARRATGTQILNNSKRRGLDPIGVIVNERTLPDVVTDAKGTPRYNISKADEKLENTIDQLDDQLDSILSKASLNVAGQVRLTDVKQAVVDEIKKEMRGDPDLKKYLDKVEDDFSNFELSYGRDFVSLNELNNIKRKVRKSVKFDTPSLDQNARYHEGQVMMRVIEQVGKTPGLGDVKRINKEMANRIEAQRLLRKFVEGKSVADNPGWRQMMGRNAEAGVTAGAEALGQAAGAPVVGALSGRYLTGLVNRSPGSAVARLNPEKPKRQKRPALLAATLSQGTLRGYQEEVQQ